MLTTLIRIFLLCCAFQLSADVASIVSTLANLKQAVLEKEGLSNGQAEFLVFFNFDNTILDGDSTDGSYDLYGKTIFKGLAQVAIESGLSKKYSRGGFSKYLKHVAEIKDQPKAYAYSAQILAGASEAKVLKLATDYFNSTLSHYFFQAAIELISGLQNAGITIQVITASPQIFVQGAAPLLGISPNDVYGMKTLVKDGILTDEMVLPLTSGQGKVDRILQILFEKRTKNNQVFLLAGIGNYNLNDMPFLKWTVMHELPVGKPLAIVDYRPPPINEENFVLFPLVEEVNP